MLNQLCYKRLSNSAMTPTRGSDNAVGYDLYAAHNAIIPANGKVLIPTDLAFCIPVGHYGRIAPRSGFSWKKHTDIGAGVIDPDYRGNVRIMVFNHSTEEIIVNEGDRIAQLILECVSVLPIVEVDELGYVEWYNDGSEPGSIGIRESRTMGDRSYEIGRKNMIFPACNASIFKKHVD